MLFLNVHSRGKYPSNVLSNFYTHDFVFEGVSFRCMEGFLQSLKIPYEEEKIAFSKMEGLEAKLAGTDKEYTALYWRGKRYDRYSKEYLFLLMQAYEALCSQNVLFQDALRASYPRILTHTIGKWKRKNTVLTWWEFTHILTKLRTKVVRGMFQKTEGEK